MSRFRRLSLLSVLLSIVATTMPAHAEILMAQNHAPFNSSVSAAASSAGNLIKELNLTPDQIQKLRQIRANAQGKNKERRQALRTAKQELTQLLQSNASADLVRQKRQQVQSLQREIADSNFENTLAIREILTPAQRLKWQQLIQQRRQNRIGN